VVREMEGGFVWGGGGGGGGDVLFINCKELSLNKMWLISEQTHLLLWRHNKSCVYKIYMRRCGSSVFCDVTER